MPTKLSEYYVLICFKKGENVLGGMGPFTDLKTARKNATMISSHYTIKVVRVVSEERGRK